MNPELVVAVAVPLIGGLAWLFQLHGRVKAHEASCAVRQKQLDERHADIGQKLALIDRKLDRLLDDQRTA